MTAPTSASDTENEGKVGAPSNEVESLVDLAHSIVQSEKIRALKAKGRPVTKRALIQWLRSMQYKNAIATTLLRALTQAEQLANAKTCEAFYRFVRMLLIDQIPLRGRPMKGGILSRAMRSPDKRRVGRPSTMTLAQEKEWVRGVARVKFEMLGELHKIKSYGELYRRHLEDPQFEADVSDAQAIEEAQQRFHMEHGTDFDRSTLPALKARYSREKRPPPKP